MECTRRFQQSGGQVMQLRIVTQWNDSFEEEIEILQYRNEDKWIDGSTTENGKWVHGEWKDVPKVGWVDEV